MGHKILKTEGKRIREMYMRKAEQLENEHIQRSYVDTVLEFKKEDKVPVYIDEKTTLWINREKCYQDEQGNWHKIPKQQVN